MLEFLGSRFNYHIGQLDNLIKNISLIQNFQKQEVREKKMYLRGVLDSAHFHRMRKVTIQLLDTQKKHGRSSYKLSIISKQS
jgi:hypothetical protein